MIRAHLGSAMFAAQYLQAPVPPDGAVFKRAWLCRYDAMKPNGANRLVQSWDTAAKVGQSNDYSVCTTWAQERDKFYLLHVLRDRLEFPALQRKVIDHARTWNVATILIEDANSGTALLQNLRAAGGHHLNLLAWRPTIDKETRALQQAVAFEAGRVHLPENADWLATYETELLGFPNARHDDQVDSTTQFLAWSAQRPLISISGPVRE